MSLPHRAVGANLPFQDEAEEVALLDLPMEIDLPLEDLVKTVQQTLAVAAGDVAEVGMTVDGVPERGR